MGFRVDVLGFRLEGTRETQRVNGQVTDEFLAVRGDVTTPDREGATALHYSAGEGQGEVAKVLLDAECGMREQERVRVQDSPVPIQGSGFRVEDSGFEFMV